MMFSTVTLVMIAMAVCSISATSLSSSSLASKTIIRNMVNQLGSLQNLINSIIKRKCDQIPVHGPHGAVYIRWGHTKCPGFATKQVYSGYAGGAHYTQTGGAADYVCLHPNPNLSNDRSKYTHGYGYLYGGEYEFGGSNSLWEHDVPCAVCQSVHRSITFMQPGRDICPKGWHREYKGLLMSGDSRHNAASQYVCVDNAQKVTNGSNRRNHNGKLFYPVKTQCGSLRCPPYKNNQLVTCAVCTR